MTRVSISVRPRVVLPMIALLTRRGMQCSNLHSYPVITNDLDDVTTPMNSPHKRRSPATASPQVDRNGTFHHLSLHCLTFCAYKGRVLTCAKHRTMDGVAFIPFPIVLMCSLTLCTSRSHSKSTCTSSAALSLPMMIRLGRQRRGLQSAHTTSDRSG